MSGRRPQTQAERPGRLPDRNERCVWMNAGLVTYKLCDRDFECDGCPLHIAFCGPRDGRLEGDVAGRFPSDRGYHSGHTWARVVGDGRVRVGLDAFAAALIGRAQSAVLPPSGSHVAQGQAGCWLVSDEQTIPLLMPLSGTVTAANGLVRRYPGLVVEAPYDDGWLVEISGAEVESQVEGLDGVGRAEVRAEMDQERMIDDSVRYLRAEAPEVGPTLQDGGVPVRDLRRLLGAERYHRLVVKLLLGGRTDGASTSRGR